MTLNDDDETLKRKGDEVQGVRYATKIYYRNERNGGSVIQGVSKLTSGTE